MRQAPLLLAMIALTAAPAQAQHWRGGAPGIGAGGFIGARLQVSLGSDTGAKARAQLALAPTASRIDPNGMVQTRIGDGLALDFARNSPTLLVARTPVERLPRQGRKMGISTVAWVGIGVSVVAVGGFLLWADAVRDSGD